MREFIIGALNDEMGLQAWDPVLCSATDPDYPTAVTSPAGFHFDPAQDEFARPAVCDNATDGDGDGVVDEIDPALVFKPAGQCMIAGVQAPPLCTFIL